MLDELDYAVDLGVLSMPAIAVNGRLVCPTLPDEARWGDIQDGYIRAHIIDYTLMPKG